MTGYQEVLTDPSYTGQIVTMTYPLIGNYGINSEDRESKTPQVDGFIVRECTRIPSNFRSHQTLDSYLKEFGILGLEGIDTRALVRRLRVRGAMGRARRATSMRDLVTGRARRASKRDLVKTVMREAFAWSEVQQSVHHAELKRGAAQGRRARF